MHENYHLPSWIVSAVIVPFHINTDWFGRTSFKTTPRKTANDIWTLSKSQCKTIYIAQWELVLIFEYFAFGVLLSFRCEYHLLSWTEGCVLGSESSLKQRLWYRNVIRAPRLSAIISPSVIIGCLHSRQIWPKSFFKQGRFLKDPIDAVIAQLERGK